jgi:hypothetical protein
MQRRGETGQPVKGKHTNRPKARKAPTVHASSADLQAKLDRRTRELEEALQQQTATSEVLSIIRRSPADAQPVFDAIVQSAAKLCGAIFSVVYLCDGDRLRIAATKNFTREATSHISSPICNVAYWHNSGQSADPLPILLFEPLRFPK